MLKRIVAAGLPHLSTDDVVRYFPAIIQDFWRLTPENVQRYVRAQRKQARKDSKGQRN
jgi:hypothetical protein